VPIIKLIKIKVMNTITVKKGATVEDNFCGKHIVKEDFEAKVVERQHVEPLEPYYICVNDGKFISGLEDVMDGQCFFVKESDAAKA
jgi:hypothetical protein